MNKTLLLSAFVAIVYMVTDSVVSQEKTNDPGPQAVACMTRIQLDVYECGGGEIANNLKGRDWCCNNYQTSQCALKKVFAKCNETETREVLVYFFEELEKDNQGRCKDWPFNTTEC